MAPSSNTLDANTIVDYMLKSLPTTDGNKPQPLKDAYCAIALFCHACMLAVGFRLIGLGEDHKIEARSEQNDVQPLPAEWNASSSYAFRYAHSQSSMEFLVKVNRLSGKALVFGIGLGDDKTASFEVKANDYTSEGSIKEASTAEDQKAALRNVFISSGRISDLATLFKNNIIQKLAPGIQKAGYEESSTSTEQTPQREGRRPQEADPLRDDGPRPARSYPFDDPLAAAPRRPYPVGDFPPPGFEDEYEINRPPRGMQGGVPPFGNIGERDLYPPGLGPNDPLRIGPGGGGFRGGGGMYPTFDDPIFGGREGARRSDLRAPPGARYDPIGPGDGPPNARGGPRSPGSGGGFGAPPNPFSGFGSGDFI